MQHDEPDFDGTISTPIWSPTAPHNLLQDLSPPNAAKAVSVAQIHARLMRSKWLKMSHICESETLKPNSTKAYLSLDRSSTLIE